MIPESQRRVNLRVGMTSNALPNVQLVPVSLAGVAEGVVAYGAALRTSFAITWRRGMRKSKATLWNLRNDLHL